MAVAPQVPSAPTRRERRWLPVAIVTALLLVVAAGARTVAGATATRTDPVTLGAIRVQPAAGWHVEGAVAPSFVRLHKGPVVLDVSVGGSVAGGPILVASLYREHVLEPAFASLSPVPPDSIVLRDGVPAARFTYSGITGDGVVLEGLVVAVDTTDTSVVFDARAPAGELARAIGDIRTMVEGATR